MSDEFKKRYQAFVESFQDGESRGCTAQTDFIFKYLPTVGERLERLEALLEKWKSEGELCAYIPAMQTMRICQKELETALRGES
jgi:hypothetical protein